MNVWVAVNFDPVAVSPPNRFGQRSTLAQLDDSIARNLKKRTNIIRQDSSYVLLKI